MSAVDLQSMANLSRPKRDQQSRQPDQIAILQPHRPVGREALIVEVGQVDAVEVFNPVLIVFDRQARVMARQARPFRAIRR